MFNIVFITCLLALCSISYELLLAQTLSTVMGNTVLRYSVTIGLYIASLGFGAIIYGKKKYSENLLKNLVNVEVLLAIIGATAPFLILLFDRTVRETGGLLGLEYTGFVPQAAVFLFNHSMILAIGILSGMELPMLIDLARKKSDNDERAINKVLAADYTGSMLGVIAFAFILLPGYGVFLSSCFLAMINILIAIYLDYSENKKEISGRRIISLSFILILILFFLFSDPIEGFFINKIYLSL